MLKFSLILFSHFSKQGLLYHKKIRIKDRQDLKDDKANSLDTLFCPSAHIWMSEKKVRGR